MKKKIIIGIVITLLVIAGSIIIFNQTKRSDKKEGQSQETTQPSETQQNFFFDAEEPTPDINQSIFENNATINYTSDLHDDINGKVAIIKMGEKQLKSQIKDGYYIYEDNFNNTYNIKQITNIESKFFAMSNDNYYALYKVIITYEDNDGTTQTFESAVLVANDSNHYVDIITPYLNFEGTTRFVRNFTDLYTEN